MRNTHRLWFLLAWNNMCCYHMWLYITKICCLFVVHLVLNTLFLNILWDTISQFRYEIWGPFHKSFFHHNSNLSEILLCFHPSYSRVIALKFGILHDSCAATGCAKFCSVMVQYNGFTLNPIFHRIWITIQQLFLKWAPGKQEVSKSSIANETSWKMCNYVVSISLLFCCHGDDQVPVPHICRTGTERFDIRGLFANMV